MRILFSEWVKRREAGLDLRKSLRAEAGGSVEIFAAPSPTLNTHATSAPCWASDSATGNRRSTARSAPARSRESISSACACGIPVIR